MPLYIAQSGDLDRCYRCLTDSLTTKDRATQLLIKYKSGALVTQFMLWRETILLTSSEETFFIQRHVNDFILFSYVWLILRIITNNSLMRRVLWGSQHIGEATPGLIKSKKAKQKVKTINFL